MTATLFSLVPVHTHTPRYQLWITWTLEDYFTLVLWTLSIPDQGTKSNSLTSGLQLHLQQGLSSRIWKGNPLPSLSFLGKFHCTAKDIWNIPVLYSKIAHLSEFNRFYIGHRLLHVIISSLWFSEWFLVSSFFLISTLKTCCYSHKLFFVIRKIIWIKRQKYPSFDDSSVLSNSLFWLDSYPSVRGWLHINKAIVLLKQASVMSERTLENNWWEKNACTHPWMHELTTTVPLASKD